MIVSRDNVFPSDGLAFAIDLGRETPEQLIRNSCRPSSWIAAIAQRLSKRRNPRQNISPEWHRLSIAINTHYPELPGGAYLNWRLIELVDGVLSTSGLYIVDMEYADESTDSMAPRERLLGIDLWEVYMLCNDATEPTGKLMKWQYSCGGGGEFFSDDMIIDLWLTLPDLAERIISILVEECRAHRVRVREYSSAGGHSSNR